MAAAFAARYARAFADVVASAKLDAAAIDIQFNDFLATWNGSKELRELNGDGMTVFLTTHYLEEAEALCRNIGIIRAGKLVALEPTRALLEREGKRLQDVFLELTRS